jgi:hypothetical protein
VLIEDLSKGRTGEGFDKLDKFGAIRQPILYWSAFALGDRSIET